MGDRLGRHRAWTPGRHRMCGRGLSGAPADHQTLQQAVGRQAVSAVHPGTGHLARGIQPGQFGPPVHVGDNAAAAVMRAGNDRDGLPDRVDAGAPAGGGDGGEPGLEARDPARVQEDAPIAGGLQPRVDGRGDDVARRQIAHRVNPRRDRHASSVNQHRALTADRLGDQRTPPASALAAGSGEKHRRVELDELEIADRDAGPQRQCDSVAGGALWIGSGTVEVPEAARRQDHRGRADDPVPVRVAHQHARHRRTVVQHPQGHVTGAEVQHGRGVVERALNFGAGGVAARVHDASPRVTTLARHVPATWGRFVETGSDADQFGHGKVAVGDDRAHRVRITEARARRQGVGDVGVHRVVIVRQHHGDAALCVVGGGRPARVVRLGQDDHAAAGASGGQRGGQSCDARADDDDVGCMGPIGTDHYSPPPGCPISIMRCTLRRPAAAISGST